MSNEYEHLNLFFHPQTFSREVRGGGSPIPPRTSAEKETFFQAKIQEFSNLKKSLERDKKCYEQYIDPKLIFKLEVIDKIDPASLITELDRMGIRVISPSPDKTGIWIVFAENEDLSKFQAKITDYKDEKKKYGFFNAIGETIEIPPAEKIGERLREEPLQPNESSYLDVEIWRMTDEEINAFLNGNGEKNGLRELIKINGGQITDELLTDNFCLLRVKGNQTVVESLLPLREIALIDRPLRPYIEHSVLRSSLDEFEIIGPPPDNATGIGVLDTGVIANHPFLDGAVGDELLYSKETTDTRKHGTEVAGICLYGDIKDCVEQKIFKQEIWIISVKIADEKEINGRKRAVFPEEKLLESFIKESVEHLKLEYPNCKVMNLSIGDPTKKMYKHRRQFNISALLDELSKKHKMIFIISAGNFNDYRSFGFPEKYPNYFFTNDDYSKEPREQVKIIEPSTAALGITVGSIAQEFSTDVIGANIGYSPVRTYYPSPFTRIGPGYKDMIKPEFVEEGGNDIRAFNSPEFFSGKILTLNSNFLEEAKLFNASSGTSLSAPKISHLIAKLYNKYPHYSPNLIKALLLSSADIPEERPAPLNEISYNDSIERLNILHGFYGYGKPNIKKALVSLPQNVLMLAENQIELDSVHIYSLYLPIEFINTKGEKSIFVSMVYDPLVNKNRIEYLGCALEFHLFKDISPEELCRAYGQIKVNKDATEEILPQGIKIREISLFPGLQIRNRGVHQKGSKIYVGKPKIDTDKPLTVAIVCKDHWIKQKNADYSQDYAIIVGIKHKGEIADLYNLTKLRNEAVQARIRARTRA